MIYLKSETNGTKFNNILYTSQISDPGWRTREETAEGGGQKSQDSAQNQDRASRFVDFGEIMAPVFSKYKE